MQMLVKVLETEMGENKGKPKCTVTMRSGSEVFMATLWHNNVSNGVAKSAEAAVGRKCLLDLQPEVRNGRIQYSFGYEVDFSEANFSIGKPAIKAAS